MIKALATTALVGAFVACLGSSAWAAPSIVEGVFEERPFRLFLPRTKPANEVLVFLHGMSRAPLRRDSKTLARVIRQLRAFDDRAVLFPTAKRGCAAFRPPRGDHHCWSTERVSHDLQYVERLLRHLRAKHALPAAKVALAGYSNGAYFLAKALQAGKLTRYRRVGLLAGGAPRPGRFAPAKDAVLRVCIEVARDDVKNAPWGRKLAAKLTKLGYAPDHLATREVSGGHLYGRQRAAAFFDWFLSGCRGGRSAR